MLTVRVVAPEGVDAGVELCHNFVDLAQSTVTRQSKLAETYSH